MAGPIKRSTFIVGLAVAKNPHQTLVGLYNQTLSVLHRLPEKFAYRDQTEQLTKHRLHLVEQEKNVAELEKKINDGQIEEVIQQAKSELSLAGKMEEWKPWEQLQTEAPAGQWQWP
ncbi:NADH dehydrogenase [ubiquinone] 1 alpha subcomplex subunit 5-like [Rhopilema esculentum]|uniref:NADH dehydrogenase [ubiquinone] 1 alpha subcomplex subunit 5-like n=1 Tax=Rhopilema esculentum TaxID=499914 RepID=UPI0031D3ADD9|eukprot:gene565-10253_t